ncbi:MAG: hypothetical protein HY835_10530 [Anaerolineae bacterium]|nr:hypothetical protein [Anaerolineae bacterium]
MLWLFSQILALIGLGLLLVTIAALLAPFESLGWWAGWSGKKVDPEELLEVNKVVPPPPPEKIKPYYVVYLSGIGVASADGLAPEEVDFLDEVRRQMPEAELIEDVFPYSVTNNPLTGQRTLRRLWRWARKFQIQYGETIISMVLINLRNFLQVFVSSDPRYGPLYSLGVAEEIGRALVRHNYPLGTRTPVFIIGFSGGGQVGMGVAPYLNPLIGGPVHLISIGGFLSDDPGVQQLHHLLHLYGHRDRLQAVSAILWNGRWPINFHSPWNRMRSSGRITFRDLGPIDHRGSGGYFDQFSLLKNGMSFCEHTARETCAYIRQAAAEHPPVALVQPCPTAQISQ